MRAVTIHVDEDAYREFQSLAKRERRSTSELIREAMEIFRRQVKAGGKPLWRSPPPVSVGRILEPWSNRGDLLDGYFERE